jgi:hypothetical protein
MIVCIFLVFETPIQIDVDYSRLIYRLLTFISYQIFFIRIIVVMCVTACVWVRCDHLLISFSHHVSCTYFLILVLLLKHSSRVGAF